MSAMYSRTDLIKVLAEYTNDALPKAGYPEDHYWTNVRIVLCMACCVFGLCGQFGTKYPKVEGDRMNLALCVVGYFAFSGILTAFDYFIVKSSVMCIKINGSAVHVDLDMKPFEDIITISLRSSEKSVQDSKSVGRYFDRDGYLCQENFFADVEELIHQFEGSKHKKTN